MDYSQINAAAEGYKADMTRFLRDLVKIPGESCGETVSYTHLASTTSIPEVTSPNAA